MDRLNQFLPILRREIASYSKPSTQGISFFTESPNSDCFTVVDMYLYKGNRVVDNGLVVCLEDEFIIIERDMNDKVLVDALLQAGIPREQIILAYAGEPLPEKA
jgi:hypothetical protein